LTNNFELLPAIDIASGKSVRLAQGLQDFQTDLVDPTIPAEEFELAGTKWIHLVDLDQAFRKGNNSQQIAGMVVSFPNIHFQLSGGMTDDETLNRARLAGATRINISALALENQNWLEQIFQSSSDLTFGIDVLDGEVVPRGSKTSFGAVSKVLGFLDSVGCSKYVVTDVERDGMLLGPNIDLLKEVFDLTGKPVIASGGISSLADVSALVELDNYSVSGAILGKALYVGNFTLAEALALVDNRD
jgi:phosphoribosylformimino-5-aminoimidazole carboxamide ribonucleotide (ProFAR) isomerase